jgi:hypothetical protein
MFWGFSIMPGRIQVNKEEICSITRRCFSTTLNSGLMKPRLVADFEELVAKQPHVLPTSIAEAKANIALAAAAHDEDEEQHDSESGVRGSGGDHAESDDGE